ncbi:MAG: ROK family protein, partial [Candidatus Nanopelagicales bacterium]|nr:ROK family protein [Candidatus Nanopelagicales bacterium]
SSASTPRLKTGAVVGIPVIVENDGNAAAWSEFKFGAGARAPTEFAFSNSSGLLDHCPIVTLIGTRNSVAFASDQGDKPGDGGN